MKPDRENAPVNSPKSNDSLTHDELKQYFEFSRRQALTRIDAENFEMEMRRDFAERRLKRLQHGA
jgi:hypothetical protein